MGAEKQADKIRIAVGPILGTGVALYGAGLVMLTIEKDTAAGVCLVLGTILIVGIFATLIRLDRK